MAEEEKGAKWWFRYVIVPIIGGGGAIAIITAMIEHPSESTRPAITEQASHPTPYDNQPQPQPPFKFRLAYDPKSIKSISQDVTYFLISVYIDDREAGTMEGDGSGDIDSEEVRVAKLGNHRYNVLGTVVSKGGTNEALQIRVKGQGTIYVQDGAEFMIEVDKRNTKLTHEAILRLERQF
jgi:hypothetical protein